MKSDLGIHSIEQTNNLALLRHLVLGKDAAGAVFDAAWGRLIGTDGLPQVRSMLLANPALRKEHRTLREMFHQPIARFYAAGITYNSMRPEQAANVLKTLGELLDAGTEWKVAYRIVANKNAGPKRDENNSSAGEPLVKLKYDGWITDQRVDVQYRYEVGSVSESHLKRIFEHGRGNLFLEGWDGWYLYRVVEIYKPEV